MGVSIIDRLFAQFEAVSGKFIRVIGGRRSNGSAQAFLTNSQGSMFFEGSEELSGPMSRLRVTEPFSIFDAKQQFDNAPQFYGTQTVGGGAAVYSLNQSATAMNVGVAAGDSVVRQSLQYCPYQAGRGQFIAMTGVMGAIKANVLQRIGYFDAQNGLFFEQNGSTLRVVVRSFVTGAPVDVAVDQSSWNMDRLDGSGPSGITIDMTKNQIFVMDFLWLGAGRIRFGFVVNGRIVYCHQVFNANVISVPWSTTGALPVRWEITNTGVPASPSTMLQVCASVASEGGFDPLGIVSSASTALPATFPPRAIAVDTPTPLMSIRLKTAYNRAAIIPQDFQFLSEQGQNFLAEVFVGGTLSGGVSVVTSVSAAAEMETGRNTLTGGTRIASLLGSSQQRIASAIVRSARVISSDIAGTPENLTLVVTPFANVDGYGAMTWKELY